MTHKCYFCEDKEDLNSIHHINNISIDNRKENLKRSHSNCHKQYHNLVHNEVVEVINGLIETKQRCLHCNGKINSFPCIFCGNNGTAKKKELFSAKRDDEIKCVINADLTQNTGFI